MPRRRRIGHAGPGHRLVALNALRANATRVFPCRERFEVDRRVMRGLAGDDELCAKRGETPSTSHRRYEAIHRLRSAPSPSMDKGPPRLQSAAALLRREKTGRAPESTDLVGARLAMHRARGLMPHEVE